MLHAVLQVAHMELKHTLGQVLHQTRIGPPGVTVTKAKGLGTDLILNFKHVLTYIVTPQLLKTMETNTNTLDAAQQEHPVLLEPKLMEPGLPGATVIREKDLGIDLGLLSKLVQRQILVVIPQQLLLK